MNYTATFCFSKNVSHKICIGIKAENIKEATKILETSKIDIFPTGSVESGEYVGEDYAIGNLKEAFKNQEDQKQKSLEEIRQHRYNKLLKNRNSKEMVEVLDSIEKLVKE